MRKIDKHCNLSTAYKTWEAAQSIPHPEYNSSKGEYYTDIVTQLLHCQDGLCAFTEERICDAACYNISHWNGGRYALPKPEFMGELDHFDPSRKVNEAWAWDNFLVVSTHINQKIKGRKSVDAILKPDAAHYNEFELLEYNTSTHWFTPKQSLPHMDQVRVQEMIDILGLNFGPIITKRSEYLTDKFTQIKLGITPPMNQFPTAFEMVKRAEQAGEESSIMDDFV